MVPVGRKKEIRKKMVSTGQREEEIHCRRERRKNIYQKDLRVVEERVLTEAYIFFSCT